MTKKPLISATAFGILTLLVFRFAALPAQLNRTPYHDATLGEDLLRLFFLEVPIWIYGVSVAVFALTLWLSKKKALATEACSQNEKA